MLDRSDHVMFSVIISVPLMIFLIGIFSIEWSDPWYLKTLTFIVSYSIASYLVKETK